MIDYRHEYAARQFYKRNEDFIEHVILGLCLVAGLAVILGWL